MFVPSWTTRARCGLWHMMAVALGYTDPDQAIRRHCKRAVPIEDGVVNGLPNTPSFQRGISPEGKEVISHLKHLWNEQDNKRRKKVPEVQI